jgi:peroxiredoxin
MNNEQYPVSSDQHPMNKMKYLIILILLPLFGFSEPVKITGTAPGAEGKRIEVLTYSDLISFQEITLATSLIDSTGNFSLSLDISQTIYVNLSIDFHRAELFLEPSKIYRIKVEPMDYNEMKEVNPFIQSAKLGISFDDFEPNELNSMVQAFNNQYDEFLLKNFNALYRDRNKSKLDTFTIFFAQSYATIKNSYLTNYINYKLAGLVQLTQAMNQAQIGKKYFSDAPILYENLEYMDFFNQYFSKYITATCRALKFTDYKTLIEGTENYKRLMKALEADTILRKPQLRELVLLKGLLELHNTAGYSQEKIIALLNTISIESKFPENRNVADNILKMLTKLRPGTPAPGFKLKNKEYKEVTLSEFKGKPVVLNFWTTYCQGCVTEMDRMKPIYDKFKDQVAFISISADKDYYKSVFFINLKPDFVWNFLHIGDQYDLLKQYDVRSYPLFVLIDKDGNIVKYPADLPGSGLELSLQKLVNE